MKLGKRSLFLFDIPNFSSTDIKAEDFKNWFSKLVSKLVNSSRERLRALSIPSLPERGYQPESKKQNTLEKENPSESSMKLLI